MKGDRIKMSYSVIRMQKIKMGGVRGIQNHDQRITESLTNPDINPEKSELNEDIHEEDHRTYYMRIKDRIDELNLPKAPRKDAVVMCEFIATSDKAYFENMPPEEQKRFFKASYDFIADRYGKENIVHATVHYDEKTPHLHMGIVPVTKDDKLSCYQIFDKKELISLQQDFNKHMNDKGFELEKGESREEKRKHLDTQKYKEVTLKERIADLEAQRAEAKTLLADLDAKINKLHQEENRSREQLKINGEEINNMSKVKVSYHEINAIEGKSVLMSKNKVTLDIEELAKLKDGAIKSTSLEYQIENVRGELQRTRTREERMESFAQRLKEENTQLKGEVQKLKGTCKTLSDKQFIAKKLLAKHGVDEKKADYLINETYKELQKKQLTKEKALKPKARDMGREL
jgi:uncharacterized coiled-coil protein SlyX